MPGTVICQKTALKVQRKLARDATTGTCMNNCGKKTLAIIF
jgi:hypothetical protein